LRRSKPNNKKHHVIYLTIIIGLAVATIALGYQQESPICDDQPPTAKLEKEIEELKAKDHQNVVMINNLQNQVNLLTPKPKIIP
jgi:predicted transcriptional regulator